MTIFQSPTLDLQSQSLKDFLAKGQDFTGKDIQTIQACETVRIPEFLLSIKIRAMVLLFDDYPRREAHEPEPGC